MKDSESKTSSNLQLSDQEKLNQDPFFKKEGQGGLFAESGQKPFFSPSTVQPKLKIGQANDKYEQKNNMVGEEKEKRPDSNIEIKPMVDTPTENNATSSETNESLRPKANINRNDSSSKGGESDFETSLNSTKGNGQSLDLGIQSKMEQGFGTRFNEVKIHNYSEAHNLSNQIQAKAFTHGQDIYFNKGSYNPSSSEGKVLLAHELTHTIQQKGATKSDDSGSTQKVEQDASRSTLGVISRMFLGAKDKINRSALDFMPRVKTGLRVAKCGVSSETRADLERRRNIPAPVPPQPQVHTAAVAIGERPKHMKSYIEFQERRWRFFFSKNGNLNGATSKPASFNYSTASRRQNMAMFDISKYTGEVSETAYNPDNRSQREKLEAAYNWWPARYYAIFQSVEPGSSEDTNTCNVFVGDSLFEAGMPIGKILNNGKYWGAAQIHSGGGGNFTEIDKVHVRPGDVAAWATGHSAIVEALFPDDLEFSTREGYHLDNMGGVRSSRRSVIDNQPKIFRIAP